MKNLFRAWLQLSLFIGLVFSNGVIADDKQQMQELGELLALSIRANDFNQIDKKFDMDRFINKVADGLAVMESERADFKKGMQQALSVGLMKKMFTGLESIEKTSDFIGLFSIDNSIRPVVRLNYAAGGVNYIELELVKTNQGYRIVDMFVAANGQYLSDTVTQGGMMIMAQPGGWVASLVDDQSSRENVIKIIHQAVASKNKGDMAGMYQALQQLPEKAKRSEIVQLMLVTAASAGLSEDIYKKELANLAKNFGDSPRYAFMLVDYYFYEGNYQQALKSVSLPLKRYNNDAALLILRASIHMSAKDYTKAYADINAAAAKEPNLEDIYWTAVTLSLTEGKYQKTLDWLGKLESQFGYEFAEENFAGQEMYQGFAASNEFKQWIASKNNP
jgi:hypothetical protein